MALPDLVMIVSRLAFGAIATVLAVILWSLTRDTAWLFVVMATIFRYGDVLYRTFRIFGIVVGEAEIYGMPVMPLVLENLPTVLFITAFAIMIGRSRR